MRWKLILLFLVVILIINVEAKTLTSSESKTINKFEDGETSEIVEDREVFYINVPKDVSLTSASLDIQGNNAKDVKAEIDGKLLFENSSLEGTINLDLKNNVSTTCDIICRWKLDVRVEDGEVNVKNLIISYSFSKTPLFVKYMQDVKFSDVKEKAFDLDEYFYGSNVRYKNMTSKTNGLDHINVVINSNGDVDFISEAGWEGTGYVYFVADDDTDTARSNEIKLIVGGGQEKPYQFSPVNSTVVLLKEQQQAFGVSGSGNFKVDWYLNEKLVVNNSFSYTYSSSNIGVYNIEARIGSIKRLWIISVLEPSIVNPEIPNQTEEKQEIICGDGLRDESENCGNCPADVSCGANAKCVNGACVVEEKTNYTLLILILIGFGLVIILIVIIIILFKKGKLKLPLFKKKIKAEEEKIEDLGPLRNYLLENLKSGYSKDDLIKSALGQGWKREQIDKILSEQPVIEKRELAKELEPLRDYIINGVKNNFKKEDLINAALKIGWRREQVNEVLKWI